MTSDVVIRPAGDEDLADIRAIIDESFTPYVERIGARPYPMDADYPALIAAENVWVAEQQDAVCGVLVLIPHEDHLMLETIGVRDRVRGIGVGAALMAFAEERARALDLPEVQLYTNEMMWENLDYYPRLGYVEQRRETVREVFRRVIFTKSVGQ